jgi:hypothetical protein
VIVDKGVDIFAEAVPAIDHQTGAASEYPIGNRLTVRPKAV